jgi:hypothetical protein
MSRRPSIVNGKAYAWVNGDIDCGPAELPIVPRGSSPSWRRRPTRQKRRRGDRFGRWRRTVPEGRRNGSLTRLAGAMRRVGADCDIAFGATHCNAGAASRRSTRRGRNDRQSVCGLCAGRRGHGVASTPDELPETSAGRREDPGPLPAELLNVPGFIADVIAYNLAGAHKPQPVLALAGALSLWRRSPGRKITDTQGTRTNLYCIGVADTSTGKERAREVNKELLYHAGLPTMIGPENFGSAQGLVMSVVGQPAILFQVDELGAISRQSTNRTKGFCETLSTC